MHLCSSVKQHLLIVDLKMRMSAHFLLSVISRGAEYDQSIRSINTTNAFRIRKKMTMHSVSELA